jgi:hypothetical protein
MAQEEGGSPERVACGVEVCTPFLIISFLPRLPGEYSEGLPVLVP